MFVKHTTGTEGKCWSPNPSFAGVWSSLFTAKLSCILYNSFVAGDFDYCPLVWHFCGVINNNKLEKIQERSLRILFNDYESDVHDLLDSIGGQTLAWRRLKYMFLKVYKCIKKVNAPCLQLKYHTLSTQNIKTGTALCRTTRDGLRTFSHVGSHL